MTARPRGAPRNRLLAALPPEDLARLTPALEPVDLPNGLVLSMPGEAIGAAHFIESGAVSAINLLADGSHVEVGIIGGQGVVGLPLPLGDDTAIVEKRVQMPGTALRLPAARLREAMEEAPALRRLLLRYALAFHGLVAQTAARNTRHGIKQRLARWLLPARDRADGDELPLTHEFLSMMLGVRRAGVTVAAGALRRQGLICYDPGRVTILDRGGLEAASCECYRAGRADFGRLVGSPPG